MRERSRNRRQGLKKKKDSRPMENQQTGPVSRGGDMVERSEKILKEKEIPRCVPVMGKGSKGGVFRKKGERPLNTLGDGRWYCLFVEKKKKKGSTELSSPGHS